MAGSSPPGSASRFAQMFGSLDLRSEQSDLEQTSSGAIDPHASVSIRQRLEAPVGSLSSSMNIPTRSYFHRPVHTSIGAVDPHPTSSKGVRQETAELASRALAEDADDPVHSPLLRMHGDQPTLFSSDAESSSSRNVIRKPSFPTRNVPGIIPEVSESPSESTSPPASQGRPSMLTQLIRTSPPKVQTDFTHDDAVSDEEMEVDFDTVTMPNATLSQPHERTSLLRDGSHKSYGYGRPTGPSDDVEYQLDRSENRSWLLRAKLNGFLHSTRHVSRLAFSPRSWDGKKIWDEMFLRPVGCLPAVLLGLLLNILDALSYGMILFPLGQPLFADLGPDGISMFYVSCIVAQLVYSLGGSVFRGGVGSEMIEVVPFFHKMAFTIMQRVGDNPRAILATTVLSYSLSSILTGAIFFLLGQCHLGALIGFFPRHILIGCIGGVGWFLVATGLEVSANMNGNLEYNLATLKRLFRGDTIALWTIPLALALALFVVKRWVRHSLTDAAWFISIIVIFYIVIAAIPNLSVEDLRGTGWVFEAPAAGVPWWHFYTLYDFTAVDWAALVETIPAMLALTFFGVLHVPINVPALGLSTGEDNVDVDRELKAHGYSNALSGLVGSIQNYLVYTNTVLFMRSGGDSRLAGVMLAVATFGIMIAGPVIIGYIPIMVVGTLIFFLGLDLMREALIDTVGRVHKLEYLTIMIIVVTMGAYDFVVGILTGIVLACVSFVFQSSQISAIRGTLPGGLASSMVRRHPMQHRYLHEVGRQIYVMKLAGYLFFGTIVGVENSIRAVLRDDAFNSRPIQFLVIDLSKVDGVDFSAAEAFTRIKRILAVRDVRLVLSGFTIYTDVGRSLQNVGLLDGGEDGIEYFEELNAALEHCENELLKAFYQQRAMLHGDKPTSAADSASKILDVPASAPSSNNGARGAPSPNLFPKELAFSSPRRGQLHTAAATTLREQAQILGPTQWQRQPQPLQLILQTFANFSEEHGLNFWAEAVPFFSRQHFTKGMVLYRADDEPDGFYLIETGILRATYDLFPAIVGTSSGGFTEVIAAGATCGELPFFSDTRRTATVLAERESIVWVLKKEQWERCQKEKPALAAEILKIGLRLTSERMMVMAKYMLLAGT